MFEGHDFDSIMEEMLSEVDETFDAREGSVIYDALAPAAMRLSEFYLSLDMLLKEVFADTASYFYLAKRAAERGLFPYEATCAVCKMVVTPPSAAIAIGDRFYLGDLNYVVTSLMDKSAGAYQIACETPGAAANQQMGELLPIETEHELNDLSSAKITEILIPGEEEEEVEAFRKRYFDSFGSEAFGGNKADYVAKVNALDGVGGCKVMRRWNGGFHPASLIPDESVKAWIDSVKSGLPENVLPWLTAVYAAASDKLLTTGGTVEVVLINSAYESPSVTLVHLVQETLDPESDAGNGEGIAPIGHVVRVRGVSEYEIHVDVSGIEYREGYAFSNVKGMIEEAIDAYFLELRKAWALEPALVARTSQIESRLLGLKEYIVDVSGVRLNGLEENIRLDETAIPVRGDVVG